MIQFVPRENRKLCTMTDLWRNGVMLGLCLILAGWASFSVAQAKIPGLTAPSEFFTESTHQQLVMINKSWDQARHLPGVMTGPKRGPVIMVFFDPNCPFCARLWKRIHEKYANLIVKWIPVAFVHSTSLGMAARILSTKDPQKALAFNEDHYHFTTERGGLLPLYPIPPKLAAAIKHNTRFWRKRFGVTPTILYPLSRSDAWVFLARPSHRALERIYNYALSFYKKRNTHDKN